MRRAAKGFTLIELMIVVAIVAILAAIAYPSYQDSVRKGRRAEGKEALLRIQLAQEKFRVNNAAYAADGTLGDFSTKWYTVTVTANSATGFSVSAAGKGDQANDTGCTPLTLAVANAGETRGPDGCW